MDLWVSVYKEHGFYVQGSDWGSVKRTGKGEESRFRPLEHGHSHFVRFRVFAYVDGMKKSLYTSAAQIKLLADVPEQV
jgi:hypothetical protein